MRRADRVLLCYVCWCLYALRRITVSKRVRRRSRWSALLAALAIVPNASADGGAIVHRNHPVALPCRVSDIRVRLHGHTLPQDYANTAGDAEWRYRGRIVAWFVPDSYSVDASRTVRVHWWCG